MAKVIFYSTGEIFWVSDPPLTKPHIGVPYRFPPVPPDQLFSYAMAAHAIEAAGHTVFGAYGRQRKEVRERNGVGKIGGPDPQFLALGEISDAHDTVLILIATDTDSRENGGSDDYPRIPFSKKEQEALKTFRSRGGGVYVTWDHGQLGYKSLMELDLAAPIEPEPDEPLRPNVTFSNDSTDQARVETDGFKRLSNGQLESQKVLVSVGPPAGYLQKIVPAELLYKPTAEPHPIFNGVGAEGGIWIPAHSHEGKLKIKASLKGIDETDLPEGVKTLAVHVPTVETTFVSFAVMARKDAVYEEDVNGNCSIREGAIIWDTSFHHLCDINWSSTGQVPWDNFAGFSAETLWQQQFSPEQFESRLDHGMIRLFINAIKWLAGELQGSPSQQVQTLLNQPNVISTLGASKFIDKKVRDEAKQLKMPCNNYPSDEELSTASPG